MRPVKTIEMQACQFSKFIAFEYSGSCFIFMRRNMKWNLAQHLASISVDQLRFSEFLDLLDNVAHAIRGGAVWKEKLVCFNFILFAQFFLELLQEIFLVGTILESSDIKRQTNKNFVGIHKLLSIKSVFRFSPGFVRRLSHCLRVTFQINRCGSRQF